MYRTDNPAADFIRYDADLTRELDKRPICANRGERIQDDHYYEVDNVIICPDCMESDYRREVYG